MKIDLDAIEARANAATPGPWNPTDDGYGDRGIVAPNRDVLGAAQNACCWRRDEDLAFVVAAREDVPALVAEVRRLRESHRRLGPAAYVAWRREREEMRRRLLPVVETCGVCGFFGQEHAGERALDGGLCARDLDARAVTAATPPPEWCPLRSAPSALVERNLNPDNAILAKREPDVDADLDEPPAPALRAAEENDGRPIAGLVDGRLAVWDPPHDAGAAVGAGVGVGGAEHEESVADPRRGGKAPR